MAWSIAAARAASCVPTVLVSTDDPEIAAVARYYGAEVPFLRPAELAGDETPDLPVFEHALRWLERERGLRPELVVQLRPTSPLRPPGLVNAAVERLRQRPDADSLRTVTAPSQSPYKMWRLGGAFLEPLVGSWDEEPWNAPRQKLPVVFWQTGHVDVTRPATILQRGSMSGRSILPLAVDPRYAVDIDSIEQLELAERLLAADVVAVEHPRAETVAAARSR